MKAIKLEALIDEHHELHLKLPETVKAGRAEVIIMFEEGDDSPPPQQVAQESSKAARKFGQFRGQIHIADDFDSPLSNEFWLGEIE